MTTAINTIDAYIAQYPKDVQEKLQTIRSMVKRIAPTATERISYGIPTFHLQENLVHFAAFKHHIGFFPGPEAVAAFASQLSAYKTSKGTIQIPLDVPLPLELLEKIIRYRVQKIL